MTTSATSPFTLLNWRVRRDSNPEPPALEGRCSIQLSYERILERKTRFELATLALARRCSTTEPLPHDLKYKIGGGGRIRTFEVFDNGFTVRPLWPLGNPSSFYGASDGTRTRNLLITSQLLYQLSYAGNFIWRPQNGLEPSTSSVTG